MSNILTPIDSSDLSELIPEGDDVKYSTFCNVRAQAFNVNYKWKTHVLVTISGVAIQNKLEPYKDKGKYIKYRPRKKKEGLLSQFIPWEEFGTDVNKSPHFGKNKFMQILNKDSGLRARITITYKDTIGSELGNLCRDLWLDKLMK